MTISIRRMKDEDISAVQEVAKTSWNTTYEAIIPLDVQANFLKVAYNPDQLKRRLNHSLFLVAEAEGRIVGFANYSNVQDDHSAELAAIYLHPQYQGKGIGSALLHRGIAELDGIQSVFINVEKENWSGLSFYSAKGFQVVREFEEDFDGHLLKTIRMELLVDAEGV
ncbi:GNAT family N-acetyltransferase [Chryseomicrobium sp. FSL W7-1435]|uniref:GNAT family N-acetyltransferase n=1 Tax=Chryseomicrobium sp. FSL W7-1435 TaxID=2921704 RepID=UPI00315AABD2